MVQFLGIQCVEVQRLPNVPGETTLIPDETILIWRGAYLLSFRRSKYEGHDCLCCFARFCQRGSSLGDEGVRLPIRRGINSVRNNIRDDLNGQL
jgi:hypothetical protein